MDQRKHELLLPVSLPPATPIHAKPKSWSDSFNRKRGRPSREAMERQPKFNAQGGKGILRLDVELSER